VCRHSLARLNASMIKQKKKPNQRSGFGGRGRCHRARYWVLHVPGRDDRQEKMINKYAAIVYIRLNASMIKQKKANQR